MQKIVHDLMRKKDELANAFLVGVACGSRRADRLCCLGFLLGADRQD